MSNGPHSAKIALPRSILEKLKSMAEAEGVQVEELIIEKLVNDLNLEAKVKAYWEMSEAYLQQAEDELARGNLRQASEKLWGSAALAVKAVAHEKERRRLTSHGELWEYVNKLIGETGDSKLGSLWRSALSMHVNFYEGWAPKEEVERALRDVDELLRKLRKESR